MRRRNRRRAANFDQRAKLRIAAAQRFPNLRQNVTPTIPIQMNEPRASRVPVGTTSRDGFFRICVQRRRVMRRMRQLQAPHRGEFLGFHPIAHVANQPLRTRIECRVAVRKPAKPLEGRGYSGRVVAALARFFQRHPARTMSRPRTCGWPTIGKRSESV